MSECLQVCPVCSYTKYCEWQRHDHTGDHRCSEGHSWQWSA